MSGHIRSPQSKPAPPGYRSSRPDNPRPCRITERNVRSRFVVQHLYRRGTMACRPLTHDTCVGDQLDKDRRPLSTRATVTTINNLDGEVRLRSCVSKFQWHRFSPKMWRPTGPCPHPTGLQGAGRERFNNPDTLPPYPGRPPCCGSGGGDKGAIVRPSHQERVQGKGKTWIGSTLITSDRPRASVK